MTPKEKEELKNRINIEKNQTYEDYKRDKGGYCAGRIKSYNNVIRFIEKMPETKKVKVPRWYANAIKWGDIMAGEPKSRAEIVAITMLNKNNFQMFNAKKQKWISDNLEIAISAIWDGCEVDKPLYIMPVPYSTDLVYYGWDKNHSLAVVADDDAATFTTAEICEFFPKIKDFAEEVTS